MYRTTSYIINIKYLTMRTITTFLLFALLSITAMAQSADRLYEQGKDLYDREKYKEALAKLQPAADKGHKKAQYRLGRMYQKGRGVPKDHAKAVSYYEKAAAQGHTKSIYRLGMCYFEAKGVPEDKAKAKQLILKAVNDKEHGKDILYDIKADAKDGDEDAKEVLKLIGKK